MENSDYKAKLEYIRRLVPDHAQIPQLTKGKSFVNEILINKIIDQLPTPYIEDEDPENTKKESSPDLQRLYLKQKNFLKSINDLSNSFHECRNDRERATVSDKIAEIEKKLTVIQENIDFFRKYKELPKVENDPKYPIPDTLILMIKKKQSLASMITQTKKQIEAAHQRGADPQKILEKQKRLTHLRIHKVHVEKAIASKAL